MPETPFQTNSFSLGMPMTASPKPYSIQVSTDISSKAPYQMFHCRTEIASTTIMNNNSSNNSFMLPSQRNGLLHCNVQAMNPKGSPTPLAMCTPINYDAQSTNTYNLSYSPVSGCSISSNNNNNIMLSSSISTLGDITGSIISVSSSSSSDLSGASIDVSSFK
jgi:hypothetical protein